VAFKRGFAVYLDTRGTLVGEQFLTVIVDRLRQCDAVPALISALPALAPDAKRNSTTLTRCGGSPCRSGSGQGK
jgi:hypothetical protein